MTFRTIIPLLCLCLSSCLDFGKDIDLSGAEVTDKELAEVTHRTGIEFPEGTVGLGYYFLGSGIDPALALKASIPNDERLNFLKNEIFEKGDKSKCSTIEPKRSLEFNVTLTRRNSITSISDQANVAAKFRGQSY